MAAVCVLSEDQFQCPVCLEVFADPVSTPCGHSFCKRCINLHWDSSSSLDCPICKERFSSRPALRTNIVMSQMVTQFKNTPPLEEPAGLMERPALGASDVPCDLCPEPRLKAQRSCLQCLASYCHQHVQPHVSNPRLRRHQLVDAAHDLDERLCPAHSAPIDMFCRADAQLICLQCFAEEHKDHSAVPLKVQRETTEAKVKALIQERRQKVQEMERSVELSQENANKEIERGVKVFNALTEQVQRGLQTYKRRIEEIHEKTEKEATENIKKLKQEISDLEQKEAEMETSSSVDNLQFLQRFSSVGRGVKDWSKVSVTATYCGMILKPLNKLQDLGFAQECKKVYMAHLNILKQRAAVVTLDPDTAHGHLQVSEMEVTHTDKARSVSACGFSASRFWTAPYVLGKQKFSSGQVYFEVVVRDKIQWALGVANDSASRSGEVCSCSWRGFWLMTWDNEKYRPAEVGGRTVSPKSIPQKIGVFVDYAKRSISFHNTDTAECIGSITDCSFSGDIRPIFSPGRNMNGKNSAPLKLEPVGAFRAGLW